jgi:hypothetical protein
VVLTQDEPPMSYSANTIAKRLRDVDITAITPLRALQMLDELQQLAYHAQATLDRSNRERTMGRPQHVQRWQGLMVTQ